MKKIAVHVGDYVLIDPCRWGNAHPQAWIIGIVDRELETEGLRRFLVRYLTPTEHGLYFGIHTPRSMRAVGSEAHVRRVHAGVLEHMQKFVKLREKIEKAQCANEKHWNTYIAAKDAFDEQNLRLWHDEQTAMKALHQPGLIRWSERGGVKIDGG